MVRSARVQDLQDFPVQLPQVSLQIKARLACRKCDGLSCELCSELNCHTPRDVYDALQLGADGTVVVIYPRICCQEEAEL